MFFKTFKLFAAKNADFSARLPYKNRGALFPNNAPLTEYANIQSIM